MRFPSALLSLAVVLSVSAIATAGPIRDWVHQHRPGLVIPKYYNAPVVPGSTWIFPDTGCPTCPGCPGGVCPVNPSTGCDCCKPVCACKPGKRNADCVCYPCKCDPKPPRETIYSAQPFGVIVIGGCPGGSCPRR